MPMWLAVVRPEGILPWALIVKRAMRRGPFGKQQVVECQPFGGALVMSRNSLRLRE
jgi:hypothetical protein